NPCDGYSLQPHLHPSLSSSRRGWCKGIPVSIQGVCLEGGPIVSDQRAIEATCRYVHSRLSFRCFRGLSEYQYTARSVVYGEHRCSVGKMNVRRIPSDGGEGQSTNSRAEISLSSFLLPATY